MIASNSTISLVRTVIREEKKPKKKEELQDAFSEMTHRQKGHYQRVLKAVTSCKYPSKPE
jgi:hypothetical protein